MSARASAAGATVSGTSGTASGSVGTGAMIHGASVVVHGGTLSTAEHAAEDRGAGNGGSGFGCVRIITGLGGGAVKCFAADRAEVGYIINFSSTMFAKCHIECFLSVICLIVSQNGKDTRDLQTCLHNVLGLFIICGKVDNLKFEIIIKRKMSTIRRLRYEDRSYL